MSPQQGEDLRSNEVGHHEIARISEFNVERVIGLAGHQTERDQFWRLKRRKLAIKERQKFAYRTHVRKTRSTC